MLFNSLVFVAFFLAVYALYLALRRRLRAQNLLLLAASYLFYGYWDWRFLGLILLSTVVDFVVGRKLDSETREGRRRWLLTASVGVNLSVLGFFKYFNFFAENLRAMLAVAGLEPGPLTLHIVLPVGISFYTFQTLSYTIDVYRRRMRHTDDFLDFALFVAFFPQLVAGPIERAQRLLPQVSNPREIRPAQVEAGLFLILWGYCLKIVVADNVGTVATAIFDPHANPSGLDVWVGALAYAVQIYGDFAGYSSIARGLAKLMGFELMVNFRLPYFALNPSDFWARWHISLSSWLRDYLYIPLGGNRGGPRRTYRNLMLTMLLGGLWHGAAWNFIAWGAFHGLLLVAYRRFGPETKGMRFPRRVAHGALMFFFVLVGWVFFRSDSIGHAFGLLGSAGLALSADTFRLAAKVAVFAVPMLLVELVQHRRGDLLVLAKLRAPVRVPVYCLLALWILALGVRESLELIYFQF